MPVKRMWMTSEESKIDAIASTAEKYGMSAAAFAGLCAWMGYRTLIRTIEPESVFSPSQLVDIYMAAKAHGLDMVEPDEEMRRMMEAASDEK